MKKFLIVLFLFTLLLNLRVKAQEIPIYSRLGFFFSSGMQYNNFGDLNNFLSQNNSPKVSNNLRNYTFGLTIRRLNSLSYTNLKLYFLKDQSLTNGIQNNTSFGGWGLSFEHNFNLLKSNTMALFPSAGVGVQNFNLHLKTNKDNESLYSNTDFVTKDIVTISFGMGFEKKFSLLFNDIFIGTKIRYDMPINNMKWYNPDDYIIGFEQDKIVKNFTFNLTARIEFDFYRSKKVY